MKESKETAGEKPRDNSRGAHFSEGQWADFVRGVSPEAVQGEMQSHLDSGCALCAVSVSWMRSLSAMAAAERLDVPADVVRRARAIFAPPPANAGWMEELEALAAELISNVRLDWQPAGVRSVAASAEALGGSQLLYKAGDYTVDLRIEPPSAQDPGEIIGQIGNERNRQENLDGLVVQTVAAGRTLGETVTNRFGEFVIEYPRGKKAILRLALKQCRQRIDLSLEPL